jgi:hypothetical protein
MHYVANLKTDSMAEPAAMGRLEKRKLERRMRIYGVAMDLFRTQGFERTTVNQIAEAADIVPATFFNHFECAAGADDHGGPRFPGAHARG